MTPPRKRRAQPEAARSSGRWVETATQRAIGQYLDALEAQRKLLWWPVPNGQYVAGGTAEERRIRVRKMKNDRLLKPGAVDINVLFPGGWLCVIEVKAGKNKPTPEQQDFMSRARALGGCAAVVYDFDAAKVLIDSWLHQATTATPPLIARAGA